jgi:hypothetical protein
MRDGQVAYANDGIAKINNAMMEFARSSHECLFRMPIFMGVLYRTERAQRKHEGIYLALILGGLIA